VDKHKDEHLIGHTKKTAKKDVLVKTSSDLPDKRDTHSIATGEVNVAGPTPTLSVAGAGLDVGTG